MNHSKSAQQIQDEIFAKMPAEKKVKLTSDFSKFLLKLNKLGKSDGLSRAINKSSQDFRRS